LAALIASSVLLFDEMRKLAGRILRSLFAGGLGSKRTDVPPLSVAGGSRVCRHCKWPRGQLLRVLGRRQSAQ
jgi:hypothetical protein